MELYNEDEMLEVSDSVYAKENSIDDIRALNKLQEDIDAKEKEKTAKEEELSVAEEKSKAKTDAIREKNDGDHIAEVRYELQELSELNINESKIRAELEDIFEDLSRLKDKQKSFKEQSEKMVEEFTKTYVELKEDFTKLADEYLDTRDDKIRNEVDSIADELATYRRFNSFDEILLTEEKEENKEEAKEVTEEKSEVAPVELNEVKVDEIEEKNEEVKEEIPKIDEPVVETPSIDNSIPSFENISLYVPEKEEIKEEPVSLVDNNVSTEEKTVIEDTPKVEGKPLLTSRIDKIADSNKKGIASTRNVFNPVKVESEDKKLALVA